MSEKEEEDAPGAKATAEIQIVSSNLSCVDFASALESLSWEELLQLQQQHADLKHQKHDERLEQLAEIQARLHHRLGLVNTLESLSLEELLQL